jgi:flagellar M-ring protein FliF
MKGLIDSIRKLGMARVAMLVAVTVGVLGAFAVLEFQGGPAARMSVLASDLDPQTVRQISDELDRRKIPYRVDTAAGEILVAEAEAANARAALGKTGLSTSGTTGYEIFDRGNDMAMTDFDQQVKLTRALEGEVSRTIASVRGIAKARVHIVLSHRQPFEHQRSEAQASVMLTLAGHGALSSEAIQSVVNLVAAAVPGLRPQNVTVVDSNLHLLVQAGDADDARTRGDRSEEIRQRTEARLSQAVELMLERSLGVGHVHAEASIRMNFDKVNETQERFEPDSPVVRSTQNVTSNNKTTEKAGPVSMQNNLPNADASAGASGSQEQRQEETTNYEITKTVRAIAHDQPQIERITLAVMVDGVDDIGPDGKHTWRPREQADLDRIEKLVKSATGFDEKRGDRLDIVSMPFTSAIDVAETTPAAPPALRNSELMSFIQIIAFGVIGISIIVLTARSILANLSKPPVTIIGSAEPDATVDAGVLSVLGQGGAASGGGAGIENGAAGARPALLSDETDSAIPALHAAAVPESVRKAREMAAAHPAETLALIRAWMAESKNEQGNGMES